MVVTRFNSILFLIFTPFGSMLNFYYLYGRAKSSLPGFKVLPLRQFGTWGPVMTDEFNPQKDTYVLVNSFPCLKHQHCTCLNFNRKKTPVLTMNKIELVRRLDKEVALDTLLLYTLAALHNAT